MISKDFARLMSVGRAKPYMPWTVNEKLRYRLYKSLKGEK